MWADFPPSPGFLGTQKMKDRQQTALFCATFRNNSTSSPPDLPDAVLIWNTSALLGTAKSADRQASFFCAHFRAFCAIRQALFSLCFSLRFQITGYTPVPSPRAGMCLIWWGLLPVILLIARCPGSGLVPPASRLYRRMC